jgi:hypothetical protein
MTRLVKCHNMRVKTGVNFVLRKLQAFEVRYLLFSLKIATSSFGRFQLIYIVDLVLQMGANGASGPELQIAPENRFHTNFLKKLWTYHFLFSP